jgi:alpha-tubulin suppressor-like RCC1 family protein
MRGLSRSSRIGVALLRAPKWSAAVAVFVLAALAIALAAPLSAWATYNGALAWGLNDSGQLGNGRHANRPVPVEVKGLKEVTALAGGERHSLALMKDGTVRAWGYNLTGQLGNGSTADSRVPVQVNGLKEATAIAGGGEDSLALLSDGSVRSWGYNGWGTLGDGSQTGPESCFSHLFLCSTKPVEVTGLKEVAGVALGWRHGLAVLKDGTVRGWGWNDRGQLGNGPQEGASTISRAPVEVPGLTEVAAVAAGGNHSLALLKNGTVMAWGGGESYVPVKVEGLKEVTAIAAGQNHSLALLKDGTVWAWGLNGSGQLGNGTNSGPEKCGPPCSRKPLKVEGLKGRATGIAGGDEDSLALLKDGAVMAWGGNEGGQLGTGTHAPSYVPTDVKGLKEVTVTSIASGGYNSLALATPVPKITGLLPKIGPVTGGTLVTITGTGFAGVSHVMFGSNEATVKSSSETSITVESPPGTGTAYVTVTSPNGTSPASGKGAKHAKFKYTRH